MDLDASVRIDCRAVTSQAGDSAENADDGVCEAFEVAGIDARGGFCCHRAVFETSRGRFGEIE